MALPVTFQTDDASTAGRNAFGGGPIGVEPRPMGMAIDTPERWLGADRAAAYAFAISIVLYRSITARQAYDSLLASARSSASIGMLIAGALVFNYVVTVENIPDTLRQFLSGYDLGPLQFLILVNVVLLLLGCLLEGTAILLIIVPVFIPTAQALGIDMVHFGVLVVVNIMIGLITPPYGILLFIMQSITRTPLRHIVRDLMPFLGALLVALAIITFVPDVVLWLPRRFGYQN